MDSILSPRQLLKVLVKWRRILFFNLICLTLLAVVISLVLPKRYTATASLLPPSEEQTIGIGSLLGVGGAMGEMGGLARMAGLPGMTTTSDILAKMLESRAVGERVIRDCNLLDLYGVESMEKGLKILMGQTGIAVSIEGIITVTVEADNPDLASQIANSYVKNLDLVNRKTNTSRGRATRIFLEKRLGEVTRDLARAEQALRAFQETHKTVSLEDEIVEAIKAAAQLKAEIVAREVNLGVLGKFATPDNPSVRQIKSESDELKAQLAVMEFGTGSKPNTAGPGFGAGFSVPFAKVPEVGMELARLTRDVEIQSAIYALLVQQYEQAKISEARDTPTVQVLDQAKTPERKSAPRRSRIVVLGVLLGVIVGVSASFFCEQVARIESDPDEAKEWKEMARQLSSSFQGLNRRIRGRRQ